MLTSKNGQDEEEQGFLESPYRDGERKSTVEHNVSQSPRRPPMFYLRLFIELTMAATIAVLLTRQLSGSTRCRSPARSSPVPQFPRKMYTFLENSTYLNEDMFARREATLHTLHNWLGLSAAARGYIHIPNWASFDIGEPLNMALDRQTEGPVYMMSAFHQLHCLSYLVEHFQAGYGGVELEKEVAHHSAHCFDYIRQSIMCAGDTNLEGKTEAGPGWGSSHECVDYDALLEWANTHGAMPWRTELLPGEAVL
ncbi:hypothetical protein GE09DRAFT_1100174 [Coniochaeta sp. 2T2.1]|nr:hypothetical protein GE09DRAFT_1100174 [Coniochaeta sp. 2T2.1]